MFFDFVKKNGQKYMNNIYFLYRVCFITTTQFCKKNKCNFSVFYLMILALLSFVVSTKIY